MKLYCISIDEDKVYFTDGLLAERLRAITNRPYIEVDVKFDDEIKRIDDGVRYCIVLTKGNEKVFVTSVCHVYAVAKHFSYKIDDNIFTTIREL